MWWDRFPHQSGRGETSSFGSDLLQPGVPVSPAGPGEGWLFKKRDPSLVRGNTPREAEVDHRAGIAG